MSVRYIRRTPTSRESVTLAVVSCALAASVGLVAFYLGRILVSRDRIDLVGPEGSEAAARSPE